MGNLFGSKNNTTTQKPSPQYLAAWNQLWPQAQTAAASASVAPINSTQTAAINQLNNAQTSANPYFRNASQLATQGSGPVTGGISQYLNPYQNDVTNATMANINETNAQQQNQLKGNAIAQGAWGGDRAGVAGAELARQQDLASNQTLAGLNANNYDTALSAAQNDASRALSGAGTMGSLGSAVQSGGVNAANALLGAGTLQQQTAQNQANLPMTQAQFLSSILGGSNLGGSSTTPGPSGISQIAGLATAAAPFFFKRGGGIGSYADGGATELPDSEPNLGSEDAALVASATAPPSQPNMGGLGATLMPSGQAQNLFGLDDKKMALLEAGLGILGSNSPHPLQAIGEGAEQGLAAYRQQKQMEAMANYRGMMAQSTAQRAKAMSDYYNARSQTVGDKSWVDTSGPTAHIIHRAADGTIEDHDLGIPTAAWAGAQTSKQRLSVEQGDLTERKRHDLATEQNATGGTDVTSDAAKAAAAYQ